MEKGLGDVSLDTLSEVLFGRRIRLPVFLWVLHQDGTFHQTGAARGVGYNSVSQVAKELDRLVILGMLRKYGRTTAVGPQLYCRVAHPYWEIIQAAATALDDKVKAPEIEPPLHQVAK